MWRYRNGYYNTWTPVNITHLAKTVEGKQGRWCVMWLLLDIYNNPRKERQHARIHPSRLGTEFVLIWRHRLSLLCMNQIWNIQGPLKSTTVSMASVTFSAGNSNKCHTKLWDVITHPLACCQILNIAGCACARNAGNVFPAIVGKRSRHASRHVRDARAVMHVGIAD